MNVQCELPLAWDLQRLCRKGTVQGIEAGVFSRLGMGEDYFRLRKDLDLCL